MKYLQKTDPEIAKLIKLEEKRQAETLMMIPSENIASSSVDEAVGTMLGNKYAEGYPYKRYYQGQEFVDEIENTAIERAKQLFGVPYVNVQPYSGSPANLAVYLALLSPGDTVMGLSLAFGGHLTHGANVSITGKYFNSVSFILNAKGYINYEELEKTALKVKPKLIIAGTTAYPRILDWNRFANIAKKVNAYLLADISHISGLVAAGAYPSPVPFVDIITTTTHKTLRGPRGAMIMVTDKGLHKDSEIADKIAKAVFPGLQGGPHINTIAGIAVALKEASTQKFKSYSKQIIANAKTLAEEFKRYDFKLISEGTDSHLILIDLQNKELLGNTVAEGLEKAGIILNRNSVPFDQNPPFFPSGIRLGTPGITSRGMKEKEMKKIAKWIDQVVKELHKTKQHYGFSIEEEKKKINRKTLIENTKILSLINKEVKTLCKQFPIKKTY